MPNGSTLVTFRICEPHELALRLVRRALARHGLLTPAEVDVASRIKQHLGAGVAPCTVLFVDEPALLLEGILFHRGAALGIPQPIVVSGNERRTEILLRSVRSLEAGGFPASIHDPVVELQERIVRAMETIAEPQESPLESPVLAKKNILYGE